MTTAPTSTATVVAAFVNQPKAHPKFGSIKSEDGTFYSVPIAMLPQFSPKGKYEITYTTNDKGYHQVVTVKPLMAPAANGAVQSGGVRYGTIDDITAKRIFICGLLNHLAGAGKIDNPTTVKKWWLGLEEVWEQVHKPKAQPPASTRTKEESQGEMQDSVPY